MIDVEAKAILHEAIDDCAAIILPDVVRIKNSPATTKDHYGDYLAIISQGRSHMEKVVMIGALLKAGAEKDGVKAAANIVLGTSL